ncbi:MAG: hypothetical protein QM706_14205 [Nitrospira sp.]
MRHHGRARFAFRKFAAAGLLCASFSYGTAHALPTTDSFTLSGIVNTPGVYNLASLQAYTPVTQTVTYQAGSATVNQSFTGVPLYTFLTGSPGGGGIITTPGVSNDILRDYAVVTGSDGYRTVTSLGEIHPNFGQTQSLIAYQQANPPGSTPTGLGNDGFARTTAPADSRGGRYVSNIAAIDVYNATSSSHIQGTGGGLSNSLTLAGQIVNPGQFDLADLQALPSITETVSVLSGSNPTPQVREFTGVSLYDLLTLAAAGGGIVTDPSVKNDILGKYIVVTGSDGYKATISLGELHPNFGADKILVAYDETGGDPGVGTAGFARLVVPGDVRAGRFVSNLVGIEVLNAPPAPVPVPAAAVLFATGLGGLGLFRFRSRNT